MLSKDKKTREIVLQYTYMAMLVKGSEENYLIMMFQSMNNYGQDQLVSRCMAASFFCR